MLRLQLLCRRVEYLCRGSKHEHAIVYCAGFSAEKGKKRKAEEQGMRAQVSCFVCLQLVISAARFTYFYYSMTRGKGAGGGEGEVGGGRGKM